VRLYGGRFLGNLQIDFIDGRIEIATLQMIRCGRDMGIINETEARMLRALKEEEEAILHPSNQMSDRSRVRTS
jgi:hypothetical protein